MYVQIQDTFNDISTKVCISQCARYHIQTVCRPN